MLDTIVNAIRDFFLNTVGEELCVLFCSMIPIIELRGAIPWARFLDYRGGRVICSQSSET